MTATRDSRPTPYIPDIGKAVAKKVTAPDGQVLIDLSLNESAFGASPQAIAAAAARAATPERYPDPASVDLRQAIADHFGFDPECVVCGNGSEEILDLVGRLYARPGDEILFPATSFLQFPIVAMRTGATPVPAPMNGFSADVDALLSKLTDATRIIFLDNPNNPLGSYLPGTELRRLCKAVPPHVVVVIDSAYADYVEDDAYDAGHELARIHDNVIVTQTFSKAYGLAAFRVGFGHCSPSMARVINRMRGIGNINAIAQSATIAALQDPAFVAEVRRQCGSERRRLAGALTELGLQTIPSATNFLMVAFPAEGNRDAGAALAHLREDGIIVRPTGDYDLPDYLRITIGRPQDNDAVIASLSRFML